MRVIVSSPDKFHAYHIARGAQRAGVLQRFITTRYDRYESGIDRNRVRQVRSAWLIAQLLSIVPGQNVPYWSYWLTDNLFDGMSARWIEACDIFNCFNSAGLYAMRRAKALGAITLVERSAAHPETQAEILSEEYEKYGRSLPSVFRRLVRKQVLEYEEADVIVVASEFVRRTMIAHGVPSNRMRLVPLGFEAQRFAPGTQDDSTFRVLYVGAISLHKGIVYLLEAFRRLALPDSELVLVGALFPEVRALLEDYEGCYRHVPFVPQHKLVEYYQNASVFVMPSLQDGFGMVVYEAAACGLPVIITENVGAEIRDGQDGFVVPIRDAQAIAERLLYLYQHPQKRMEMGHAACAYVQQFTWENYHRKIIGHYEELLANKRPMADRLA